MAEDKLYLLSEAAERSGATVEAIRQRIRRGTLHAIKGNDGRVRVKLTDADIAALTAARPSGQPYGQPSERPSGHHDEDSSAIKALEAYVNTLREDLARERADHAAERERWREQLDQQRTDHQAERQALRDENIQLRDGLSAEREHGRELAGKLDTAHRAHGDEAARLRQEIATLRTELARPWWRRLIGH
jgi:septal ring factor EnvC (AmiA/AmiB activator)